MIYLVKYFPNILKHACRGQVLTVHERNLKIREKFAYRITKPTILQRKGACSDDSACLAKASVMFIPM